MYADLNCVLSISALLLLSLYIKPSLPLSGGMSELSCFFDLINDQNHFEFSVCSGLMIS